MQKYILTSKSGIITARRLANLLNMNCYLQPKIISPAIRWGNTNGDYLQDTELNDKNLIIKASSKVSFSELMEISGVPNVTLYKNILPESYPVFIRTLTRSSCGKGIKIVTNEEEFNQYRYNYYSYFYDFKFEIRVHVLDGKVVKVFKKVFMPEDGSESEETYPIRNSKNNYTFKRKNIEAFPKAINLVDKIYEVLPLRFMGVDMGFIKNYGYKVIEVNTAPSLNGETLLLYKDFFERNLQI